MLHSEKTQTLPWEKAYPKSVNWHASMPVESLPAMLDTAVTRYASRPCLDFLGKEWSYAAVGLAVNRLAKGLQGLGVGKGMRVGLFLPNCPAYVVAYFALLKTGATVVNFNPLYAERELSAQVTDSGVEMMVTLDLKALFDKLETLRSRGLFRRIIVARMAEMLPFPKNVLFSLLKRKEMATVSWGDTHISYTDLQKNDGQYAPVTLTPEKDIAVLQYTGGTTGTPKGAMLTHANLRANTEQSALCYPSARGGLERMLCVIPFFHVFSMTVAMNLGLYWGACLILMPRFELDTLIKTIDRKKPTLFPAVPTIYTAINTYRQIDKYDLRSIRFCISGGAPLPVEVKNMFEKRTGCRLVEGYGLTEASPVTCCNPVEGLNKAGSIGLPLPQTLVSIRNPENPIQEMPQGERGELCIKGPQVMLGYWQRLEETENVFVDGFLRTGDIAYMDEEGYTFIVDRIKDVIVCSGYKVYPRTVEEAMYLHPAVAECLVIGIPDTYRGQAPKAFVTLRPGQKLTADELKEFLKDKISPIEMPKLIEFRASLPKTLIGKLDRKALRKEEGLI